jgi:hypothetical protein
MNIYGIETFLIGVAASALILTLFIYLRNRALYSQKIRHTPIFRQSEPTFLATRSRSRSINPRKKIEFEPTITGYVPVYPIVQIAVPLA